MIECFILIKVGVVPEVAITFYVTLKGRQLCLLLVKIRQEKQMSATAILITKAVEMWRSNGASAQLVWKLGKT